MAHSGKKLWWDAAIGDELLIEVGRQTLEVKVMGIVDADIPYGGYDTLFIPLEMLSKIVPIENLNYQFIVDTDDSKWAAAKMKSKDNSTDFQPLC